MKKLLKIVPYLLIAVFLITSISLFVQNVNLKGDIGSIKSVPAVELNNYLTFSEEGIASGSLTGFVKFNDIEDQPRTLRQYVTITAYDSFDPEYGQIFAITDTIDMPALPPQKFEPVPVFIQTVEDELIIFSDKYQNLYGFNNQTGQAFIFDNTGDNTSLITDQNDFRNFMFEFLKSK